LGCLSKPQKKKGKDMATTLIHNGCFVGALGALLDGRIQTGTTAAAYGNAVLIASSVADEVAAVAATVSLADADLATPKMELTCAMITKSVLAGRSFSSVTDADYASVALPIAAAIKQAISGWI
jgi:hypothetical protein